MSQLRRSVFWTMLASGVTVGVWTARTLLADPLPDCEYCGAADAPPESQLSWTAVIAPPAEPGERLIVSGVVYEPDGRTPVPGALMYAYHTDATGVYPRASEERGNSRRHGRLRAWLVTDAQGRYQFETIRPAPYPDSTIAAHIHATLTRDGQSERWIEDFLFEDDRLVTDRQRRDSEAEGRFGFVLRTTPDAEGTLRAERDIRWPAQETR